MKYILTLLSCLICTTVFAEVIKDVEYSLPKSAENWVIGDKIENEKSTTLIYIPEGVERQEAEEFFGVNGNSFPSDPNNLSGLQSALETMYPDMKIDFNVLEKNPDNVIYEWSAKENDDEKVHGWGHAFSGKDGTVVLGYQTKKISDVPEARSIWLPALKAAKRHSD